MRLWREVCRGKGWRFATAAEQRARRLEVFGELVGRTLASTNEVGRFAEGTRLLNGLKVMAGKAGLKEARKAVEPALNEREVLLRVLLDETIPALEAKGVDVRAYIAAVAEDKRHSWGIAPEVKRIGLEHLDHIPRRRWSDESGDLVEGPSPLRQMFYTLKAALHRV